MGMRLKCRCIEFKEQVEGIVWYILGISKYIINKNVGIQWRKKAGENFERMVKW